MRWFELALVLFVAFAGALFGAIYILVEGAPPLKLFGTYNSLHALLYQMGALLVLGYVLQRRGRRFGYLGLRWSWRDFGMGIPVAIGAVLAAVVGGVTLLLFHRVVFGTLPKIPSSETLFGRASFSALLFVLLNPFFEELIVRAFLISEIVELTGSKRLAVAISVLVQTAYHLYHGWTIALAQGCMFLALSLYYLRTRRIVPIIVAHAILDMISLIRLW